MSALKQTPPLLGEAEEVTNKIRLKVMHALKIYNDEEAIKRVLREIKDML